MFGRVPKHAAAFLGTRPNISKYHSEISTRVPFCFVRAVVQVPRRRQGVRVQERQTIRLGHARAVRPPLPSPLAPAPPRDGPLRVRTDTRGRP